MKSGSMRVNLNWTTRRFSFSTRPTWSLLWLLDFVSQNTSTFIYSVWNCFFHLYWPMHTFLREAFELYTWLWCFTAYHTIHNWLVIFMPNTWKILAIVNKLTESRKSFLVQVSGHTLHCCCFQQCQDTFIFVNNYEIFSRTKNWAFMIKESILFLYSVKHVSLSLSLSLSCIKPLCQCLWTFSLGDRHPHPKYQRQLCYTCSGTKNKLLDEKMKNAKRNITVVWCLFPERMGTGESF